MPLVSVIIPNYNHAPFLQQRVESILYQTFTDFELIILDDRSTDNSPAIIETYKENKKVSHIVYNEKNTGSPFTQWNKGVQLARGSIIWIAESDDVADESFLAHLVPHFVKDENLGLAYCQSYRYSDDNKVTGTWESWTDDLDPFFFKKPFVIKGTEFLEKYLVYKNVIPNASAVLFRKDLFEQAGQADPTVRTCSDWLTWLKIASVSDIAFDPRLFNYFRQHPQSVIAKEHNHEPQFYLKKYQRVLREKLHNYFLKHPSLKKECAEIVKKNKQLLIEETRDEGLFELGHQHQKPGWQKIIKAAFSYGFYPAIFFSAVKTQLKKA